MIKPGYNILYNGIENTIISWVIKDREKEDLSLLTSRILYFVDKVFLKHINKEYLDDAKIIIKSLIIIWHEDGHRTAGDLTREIAKVMETFELSYLRDKQINDILDGEDGLH